MYLCKGVTSELVQNAGDVSIKNTVQMQSNQVKSLIPVMVYDVLYVIIKM